MEKNTQQPVGWVWQFPDGEYYETPHHTKEECERDCCGYDGVAVPCFTAPPMPRDVLMAVAQEVLDECLEYLDGPRGRINIAAIADRYASKVQPEPVNQQLLAALEDLAIDMKIAQGNMRIAAIRDPKWEGCAEAIQPRVDAAEAAIAAAEAAQQSADWFVTTPDINLFDKTMGDFDACGETDTPQETLMLFAQHGWLHCVAFEVTADDTLECINFQITNAGRAALAAHKAQEVPSKAKGGAA